MLIKCSNIPDCASTTKGRSWEPNTYESLKSLALCWFSDAKLTRFRIQATFEFHKRNNADAPTFAFKTKKTHIVYNLKVCGLIEYCNFPPWLAAYRTPTDTSSCLLPFRKTSGSEWIVATPLPRHRVLPRLERGGVSARSKVFNDVLCESEVKIMHWEMLLKYVLMSIYLTDKTYLILLIIKR